MTDRSRSRSVLDVLSSVLVAVAAALVIYSYWPRSRSGPHPAEALPTDPVSIETASIIGNRGARVAIIEFSDFQCPFCERHFRETEPAVRTEYVQPGRVLVAFRQFPLESIHPSARSAAGMAICASKQGRFSEGHDILFQKQGALKTLVADDFASELGLDRRQFEDCLKDDARLGVDRDLEAAKSLSVTSTPTFLLGSVLPDGRVRVSARLNGARPVAQFRQLLDELLAKSQ